jgi:hypothetical protein
VTLDELVMERMAEGWAVKTIDGSRAVLERRMTSAERIAAHDVRLFVKPKLQLLVTIDAAGELVETRSTV